MLKKTKHNKSGVVRLTPFTKKSLHPPILKVEIGRSDDGDVVTKLSSLTDNDGILSRMDPEYSPHGKIGKLKSKGTKMPPRAQLRPLLPPTAKEAEKVGRDDESTKHEDEEVAMAMKDRGTYYQHSEREGGHEADIASEKPAVPLETIQQHMQHRALNKEKKNPNKKVLDLDNGLRIAAPSPVTLGRTTPQQEPLQPPVASVTGQTVPVSKTKVTLPQMDNKKSLTTSPKDDKATSSSTPIHGGTLDNPTPGQRNALPKKHVVVAATDKPVATGNVTWDGSKRSGSGSGTTPGFEQVRALLNRVSSVFPAPKTKEMEPHAQNGNYYANFAGIDTKSTLTTAAGGLDGRPTNSLPGVMPLHIPTSIPKEAFPGIAVDDQDISHDPPPTTDAENDHPIPQSPPRAKATPRHRSNEGFGDSGIDKDVTYLLPKPSRRGPIDAPDFDDRNVRDKAEPPGEIEHSATLIDAVQSKSPRSPRKGNRTDGEKRKPRRFGNPLKRLSGADAKGTKPVSPLSYRQIASNEKDDSSVSDVYYDGESKKGSKSSRGRPKPEERAVVNTFSESYSEGSAYGMVLKQQASPLESCLIETMASAEKMGHEIQSGANKIMNCEEKTGGMEHNTVSPRSIWDTKNTVVSENKATDACLTESLVDAQRLVQSSFNAALLGIAKRGQVENIAMDSLSKTEKGQLQPEATEGSDANKRSNSSTSIAPLCASDTKVEVAIAKSGIGKIKNTPRRTPGTNSLGSAGSVKERVMEIEKAAGKHEKISTKTNLMIRTEQKLEEDSSFEDEIPAPGIDKDAIMAALESNLHSPTKSPRVNKNRGKKKTALSPLTAANVSNVRSSLKDKAEKAALKHLPQVPKPPAKTHDPTQETQENTAYPPREIALSVDDPVSDLDQSVRHFPLKHVVAEGSIDISTLESSKDDESRLDAQLERDRYEPFVSSSPLSKKSRVRNRVALADSSTEGGQRESDWENGSEDTGKVAAEALMNNCNQTAIHKMILGNLPWKSHEAVVDKSNGKFASRPITQNERTPRINNGRAKNKYTFADSESEKGIEKGIEKIFSKLSLRGQDPLGLIPATSEEEREMHKQDPPVGVEPKEVRGGSSNKESNDRYRTFFDGSTMSEEGDIRHGRQTRLPREESSDFTPIPTESVEVVAKETKGEADKRLALVTTESGDSDEGIDRYAAIVQSPETKKFAENLLVYELPANLCSIDESFYPFDDVADDEGENYMEGGPSLVGKLLQFGQNALGLSPKSKEALKHRMGELSPLSKRVLQDSIQRAEITESSEAARFDFDIDSGEPEIIDLTQVDSFGNIKGEGAFWLYDVTEHKDADRNVDPAYLVERESNIDSMLEFTTSCLKQAHKPLESTFVVRAKDVDVAKGNKTLADQPIVDLTQVDSEDIADVFSQEKLQSELPIPNMRRGLSNEEVVCDEEVVEVVRGRSDPMELDTERAKRFLRQKQPSPEDESLAIVPIDVENDKLDSAESKAASNKELTVSTQVGFFDALCEGAETLICGESRLVVEQQESRGTTKHEVCDVDSVSQDKDSDFQDEAGEKSIAPTKNSQSHLKNSFEHSKIAIEELDALDSFFEGTESLLCPSPVNSRRDLGISETASPVKKGYHSEPPAPERTIQPIGKHSQAENKTAKEEAGGEEKDVLDSVFDGVESLVLSSWSQSEEQERRNLKFRPQPETENKKSGPKPEFLRRSTAQARLNLPSLVLPAIEVMPGIDLAHADTLQRGPIKLTGTAVVTGEESNNLQFDWNHSFASVPGRLVTQDDMVLGIRVVKGVDVLNPYNSLTAGKGSAAGGPEDVRRSKGAPLTRQKERKANFLDSHGFSPPDPDKSVAVEKLVSEIGDISEDNPMDKLDEIIEKIERVRKMKEGVDNASDTSNQTPPVKAETIQVGTHGQKIKSKTDSADQRAETVVQNMTDEYDSETDTDENQEKADAESDDDIAREIIESTAPDWNDVLCGSRRLYAKEHSDEKASAFSDALGPVPKRGSGKESVEVVHNAISRLGRGDLSVACSDKSIVSASIKETARAIGWLPEKDGDDTTDDEEVDFRQEMFLEQRPVQSHDVDSYRRTPRSPKRKIRKSEESSRSSSRSKSRRSKSASSKRRHQTPPTVEPLQMESGKGKSGDATEVVKVAAIPQEIALGTVRNAETLDAIESLRRGKDNKSNATPLVKAADVIVASPETGARKEGKVANENAVDNDNDESSLLLLALTRSEGEPALVLSSTDGSSTNRTTDYDSPDMEVNNRAQRKQLAKPQTQVSSMQKRSDNNRTPSPSTDSVPDSVTVKGSRKDFTRSPRLQSVLERLRSRKKDSDSDRSTSSNDVDPVDVDELFTRYDNIVKDLVSLDDNRLPNLSPKKVSALAEVKRLKSRVETLKQPNKNRERPSRESFKRSSQGVIHASEGQDQRQRSLIRNAESGSRSRSQPPVRQRSDAPRATLTRTYSYGSESSTPSQKARDLRKQIDQALKTSVAIRTTQERLGAELNTFKSRLHQQRETSPVRSRSSLRSGGASPQRSAADSSVTMSPRLQQFSPSSKHTASSTLSDMTASAGGSRIEPPATAAERTQASNVEHANDSRGAPSPTFEAQASMFDAILHGNRMMQLNQVPSTIQEETSPRSQSSTEPSSPAPRGNRGQLLRDFGTSPNGGGASTIMSGSTLSGGSSANVFSEMSPIYPSRHASAKPRTPQQQSSSQVRTRHGDQISLTRNVSSRKNPDSLDVALMDEDDDEETSGGFLSASSGELDSFVTKDQTHSRRSTTTGLRSGITSGGSSTTGTSSVHLNSFHPPSTSVVDRHHHHRGGGDGGNHSNYNSHQPLFHHLQNADHTGGGFLVKSFSSHSTVSSEDDDEVKMQQLESIIDGLRFAEEQQHPPAPRQP